MYRYRDQCLYIDERACSRLFPRSFNCFWTSREIEIHKVLILSPYSTSHTKIDSPYLCALELPSGVR